MNIQEIMSKPAITCQQRDTVNTAAQRMWESDCGTIPVVNEGGNVVGMITDRDICMAAYTQGRALHAIPVSNVMSKSVFSCRAEDSLDAAEHLMRDNQIRRVPVVDGNNRPIGVLSLNDIARYAASARKKGGLDHDVTQTLAAICRPRPRAQAAREAQPTARRVEGAASVIGMGRDA
jgi:CBS domain-containing protein